MIRHFIILILLIAFDSCPSFAQQRGMASYYSNRMHGRRMSNGDKYHKDSLTCAHAKFALGTLLKVTNIKNGKSVVVEVTDRCSNHARRIIDLSYAAAKKIGLVAQGMATVMVERYKQNLTIPYKDNDIGYDLPELDYEVTEKKPSKNYIPTWKREKKDNKKKNKRVF